MNKLTIRDAIGLVMVFILTVVILFAGVPVAWLAEHGTEYGVPSIDTLLPTK